MTEFLESGLREKIDSLMMSRVHTHSNKHSEKWDLQQEEEKKNIEEEEEPLTEDDRDDSSRSSSSHMFASSPAGSWSSQDTDVTSTPVLSVHNTRSPVSLFFDFLVISLETRNRTSCNMLTHRNVFRKWS